MNYRRTYINLGSVGMGGLLGAGSLHPSTLEEAQFLWALWCCFFIGIYAVVFPHSLFQGKLRTQWLLSAPSTQKVLIDQLSNTFWIPGLSLSFVAMWGWTAGFSLNHIVYRSAQLLFWFLLSLLLATYTGKIAQDFKTGLRGNRFRALAKETGSFPVAIGSIPTLVQTIFISTLGLLHLILFNAHSLQSYLILGIGFSALVLWIILMNKPQYFSRSLQGEAFFSEYFARLSHTLSEERPLKSLYWVPNSFKHSTKMILTLSDRNGAVHQWYWPGLIIGIGANWIFPNFSLVWASGLLFLYSSESIRIAQSLFEFKYFFIRLQPPSHYVFNLILCSFRWMVWFSTTLWIILPESYFFYFISFLFIISFTISGITYLLLTSTLSPKHA